MAKMNCKCGYILSTTQVPNDIQLRVYTDKEWEEMLEFDTIASWKVPLPKFDVWRCPKCKRVYVFDESNDKPIMIYALEQV